MRKPDYGEARALTISLILGLDEGWKLDGFCVGNYDVVMKEEEAEAKTRILLCLEATR